MSECYFHVTAVDGVTEDCFEIESRKSPSLFLILLLLLLLLLLVVVVVVVVV